MTLNVGSWLSFDVWLDPIEQLIVISAQPTPVDCTL